MRLGRWCRGRDREDRRGRRRDRSGNVDADDRRVDAVGGERAGGGSHDVDEEEVVALGGRRERAELCLCDVAGRERGRKLVCGH